MIARLWLPLQTTRFGRWAGLATAAAWFAYAPHGVPTFVAALVASAIVAGLASRCGGVFAVSEATGHLWAVAQFALIGLVPSASTFAMVLAGLSAATVGVLPWMTAGHQTHPTRIRPPTPPQNAPLIGLAALAALCVGVLAGSSGAPPELRSDLPWYAAWLVGWALWRQELTAVLWLALALACGVGTMFLAGWMSPMALGLVIAACAAVRVGVDQRLGAGAIGLSAAPLCAAAAYFEPTLLAAPIAVTFSIATLPCVLPRRHRGGPVRKALHVLPPYDRWYGLGKLRHDELFARVFELGGLDGRVLDLGCGMALIGGLKSDQSPGRYVGVDIDPAKLRAGAALLTEIGARNAVLWRADVCRWDTDERFDRVLLLDVLHYWSPETQGELLAAAAEWLAPDGRLLVRDAMAGDGATDVERGERWTTLFGFNPRGKTYFCSRSEWHDRFGACGLERVEERAFDDGNTLFVLKRAEA